MRNHFRSQLNIFFLPSATLVAGLRIFSEFAAPLLAISELKVFDFKCSIKLLLKEEIYVGFIKSPCRVLLKSKPLWRLRQQTDIFCASFHSCQASLWTLFVTLPCVRSCPFVVGISHMANPGFV